MELQRQEPPAYASRDHNDHDHDHHHDDLRLPEVPRHDPPRNNAPSHITLPDLKTVLADLPTKTVHPNVLLNATISRDPDHPLPMPITTRTSLESDTASIMSYDDGTQRSTSVSIEDPDVRLAAEALSGLGNPDFVRSPKAHSSAASQSSNAPTSRREAEPLLNLLVDAHPWVGGTVSNSLSAYNATKNFSPRIVRFGVDLVERNVGSPVANTVSSIGRRTGVEGGIRRYLDSRRPGEMDRSVSPASERGHGSKRRRVTSDDTDMAEAGPASMIDSQEFLPAYRPGRPPSYREEASPHASERNRLERRHPNRSWSAKLFISTSALGVALSESSLRSLKYCLSLLASASEHVESVMNALKLVLQEYDQSQESYQQERVRREKEAEAGFEVKGSSERDQSTEMLAQRIKQLCDNILHTIQTVVNSISTYTGGALPENARNIVKGQLLSIPQRWRWATQSAEAATSSQQQLPEKADGGEDGKPKGAEEDTRKAAHRMIAFASEGLDMMAQVNGVVKITLESAESWLQSLGRSSKGDEEMMDADDPREAAE